MSKNGFKKIFKRLFIRLIQQQEGDKVLLATVAVLIVIGLIMLSSASSVISYQMEGNSYYFLKNQLFALGIGILAFWFFSKFNYQYLKKYALVALFASIILLLAVFIPSLAAESERADSWIEIFGRSVQPSEFVKLTFLIYLSAWFAGKQGEKKEKGAEKKMTPFVIVYAIIAVLMMFQPDFGTLFIITIASFVVYLAAGGRIKHILVLGLIGVLIFAILVSLNKYQQARFKCVANTNFSPESEQLECYQVRQSLIAVGSGGLFGRGLGASRQKFLYLPDAHNDFIFSIIGEELGFVLCVILIILFLVLFYRGYLIARRVDDNFGKYLSIGIVSWLAVQVVLNIGGSINLLPMTGVPLPFISAGGSSLLATMIAIGILANISKQGK
ncbi:MAG: putative lipid II flippase FtsW [bacterium]